jgi:flagellar biosynthesis/type III secretory pathway M-ring protein FliF/YscJ
MSEPPPGGPTLGMQNTPNAERYVLEADAMRRRQLRSALLHGSQRNWRDHVRTWPAVVVGIIVVGVIVAGLAVTAAFQKTNENEKRQERQQQQQSHVATTPTPAPTTASPSKGP